MRRTCTRKISAKRASRPIAAGRARSISARMRRASAGAAPPVEMAMVTGARSTIAGMMKLDRRGRSTTFTGMLRCCAACDTRACQRLVFGRHDHQRHAREIAVVEGAAGPRDARIGDQLGDLAHHRVGDQT